MIGKETTRAGETWFRLIDEQYVMGTRLIARQVQRCLLRMGEQMREVATQSWFFVREQPIDLSLG